jgi:hypothetical protein
MTKFNKVIFAVVALAAQPGLSETKQLEGQPMSYDIGYGIIVNEGSSLMRESLIVQDEKLPARITNFEVKIPLNDRSWEYQISYTVEFDAPVSAVEVRFIPFDIWGEKNTTLSSTSIEDNGIGLWSDDSKWRASENDAIQHYAMLAYVAQVKMASGEIKRANPDIVVKEAQAFSSDFSTSDLSVGE